MNTKTDELHNLLAAAHSRTDELRDFVELVHAGFGYANSAVRVIETIRKFRTLQLDDRTLKNPYADDNLFEEGKKKAKRIQTFAENQEKTNFSYLYSIAIIRLWSIAEVMIDELVLSELQNRHSVHDLDKLMLLKGPIFEFMLATESEKMDFLMIAYQRKP